MDIIGQAAWLHKLSNIEYFEHLLAAFQAAAIDKGFDFIEGTKQYVLSEGEIDHFGRVIVRAKCLFLCPRALDAQLDRWTEDAVEDGAAMQWLHTILDGLQKRGIVLRRVDPRVLSDVVAESQARRFREFYSDLDADRIVDGALVHKPS